MQYINVQMSIYSMIMWVVTRRHVSFLKMLVEHLLAHVLFVMRDKKRGNKK
jgi:hypothetical protein